MQFAPINKLAFVAKKHAPEMLTVAGIGIGIVAGIVACKQTTKAQEILEDAKTEIDAVHQVMEDESVSEETYSEEDSKKDLALIYVKTGVKFVKLYAPAIGLAALSITSILAGNHILRKRNAQLAAAYVLVDNAFKEYRGRVVERYGKDVDQQLRYDLKAKTITETVTDENGKEKKVKKDILVPNGTGVVSGYARVYDAGNTNWNIDPELNRAFLTSQQSYANQKLRSEGFLMLSDVYKALGYRDDGVSHQVGWIYNENNPIGDNFVDFGFSENYAFMSGQEASVVLDFNVDGPILDKIDDAYRGSGVC